MKVKLKESLFNKSKKQWNIWRLQVSSWYYQNKKNKKGKSGVQGIHAFKQFIVKTINVHITNKIFDQEKWEKIFKTGKIQRKLCYKINVKQKQKNGGKQHGCG